MGGFEPIKYTEDFRCTITKAQKEKLKEFAKKYDTTIATVIRYLIDEKLNEI